jgi:hypothetical protein
MASVFGVLSCVKTVVDKLSLQADPFSAPCVLTAISQSNWAGDDRRVVSGGAFADSPLPGSLAPAWRQVQGESRAGEWGTVRARRQSSACFRGGCYAEKTRAALPLPRSWPL